MSVSMRGAAAVVGVAEMHYKRGESPYTEQQMTIRAILDACSDAGVSPREIDGFVSYAGGSNDGPILGAALMIDELRWSNMMWGGGGGSVAAALINAVTAIATGQAQCVVVYRAMSQATPVGSDTRNTTTVPTSWPTGSVRPPRSAPCGPSACSNTTACREKP